MRVKGDGMFAGNYFSYGGINSEKYELAILIVDEEQNKKIGGELDYTSFYNRYNGRSEIAHAAPSETEFEFNIEICRYNDRAITYAEHQSICRDFFNSPTYKKLIIQNPEYQNMYFNCYMKDVEEINAGSHHIGYKATVVCDTHYLWSDKKYNYSLGGKSLNVTHYNPTSLPFYTYVDAYITVGTNGGDITVSRISDNGNDTVKFKAAPANSTISLTSNPKNAYCSNEGYNKNLFTAESNWNQKWLRFVQGNNILSTSGDIKTINIEYKIARLLY